MLILRVDPLSDTGVLAKLRYLWHYDAGTENFLLSSHAWNRRWNHYFGRISASPLPDHCALPSAEHEVRKREWTASVARNEVQIKHTECLRGAMCTESISGFGEKRGRAPQPSGSRPTGLQSYSCDTKFYGHMKRSGGRQLRTLYSDGGRQADAGPVAYAGLHAQGSKPVMVATLRNGRVCAEARRRRIGRSSSMWPGERCVSCEAISG